MIIGFFFFDTAASAVETADDLVIGGVCGNVIIIKSFAYCLYMSVNSYRHKC